MLTEKLELGEKVSSEVVCSKCGVTTTTDNCNCFEGKKGEDIYLCQDCTKAAEEQLFEQTKNPNYVLGFLGGLVGASIGALVWIAIGYITQYEIGYISILIGFLTGQGVVKGSGNKRGTTLQFISGLISIVVILSAKYITSILLLNQYLADELGFSSFLWVSPFNSDLLVEIVDPISIVILVIGVLAAYRIPKAQNL